MILRVGMTVWYPHHRPVGVVMVDLLAEDQPPVPFAGDQHLIQAFTACA
jgi:hypothetical protein